MSAKCVATDPTSPVTAKAILNLNMLYPVDLIVTYVDYFVPTGSL